MASQGAKELVEELNKYRLEVSKLRNALNELDTEKEACYKKKEEFSAKIKDSIQKIKDNKNKRDALTLQVKELKPKRDGVNKGLPLKSAELEKLKKERSELAKSLNVKESPSRIKQQMEKLEFKIETDTVSFETEKELMRKIKELKKDYDKASILEESNKKIREILDNAGAMKKEANEAHKLMQEKARQSQILHEQILKLSVEIDKIKVDENEAFRKFSELKKKFNEANFQLKEKLREMNGVKNALDRISSDKREKRKQEIESILKSKEEIVNEKIRTRKKLTNEDLLVFQKFEKD
ncbi:MAG: hypothetical protein Q8R04_01510 [Nanoarchaeota archaeon]|nr:hypothetical protein [Nanoarchaeota archaeon]